MRMKTEEAEEVKSSKSGRQQRNITVDSEFPDSNIDIEEEKKEITRKKRNGSDKKIDSQNLHSDDDLVTIPIGTGRSMRSSKPSLRSHAIPDKSMRDMAISISSSISSSQTLSSSSSAGFLEPTGTNTSFERQMQAQRLDREPQTREKSKSPKKTSQPPSKSSTPSSPTAKSPHYEGSLNKMHFFASPSPEKVSSKQKEVLLPVVVSKSSLTTPSPPRIIKDIRSVGSNAQRQIEALKTSKPSTSLSLSSSSRSPSKSSTPSHLKASSSPSKTAVHERAPKKSLEFLYDLEGSPPAFNPDELLLSYDKEVLAGSTHRKRAGNEEKVEMSSAASSPHTTPKKGKSSIIMAPPLPKEHIESEVYSLRSGKPRTERLNEKKSLKEVTVYLSDVEHASHALENEVESKLGVEKAPEGESPWLTDSQLFEPSPTTSGTLSSRKKSSDKSSNAPSRNEGIQGQSKAVGEGNGIFSKMTSSKPSNDLTLSLDLESDDSQLLEQLEAMGDYREQPRRLAKDQSRNIRSPSAFSSSSSSASPTMTRNMFARRTPIPMPEKSEERKKVTKPSHGLSAASPPTSKTSKSTPTASALLMEQEESEEDPRESKSKGNSKKSSTTPRASSPQVASPSKSSKPPILSAPIPAAASRAGTPKTSSVKVLSRVSKPKTPSAQVQLAPLASRPKPSSGTHVKSLGSNAKRIDSILEAFGSPDESQPPTIPTPTLRTSRLSRRAKKEAPELIELSDDDSSVPPPPTSASSHKNLHQRDPYDSDEDYVIEKSPETAVEGISSLNDPSQLLSISVPSSLLHFNLQYFQDDIGRGHVSADAPSTEEETNTPSPSPIASDSAPIDLASSSTSLMDVSMPSTPKRGHLTVKEKIEIESSLSTSQSTSQQHPLIYQSSMTLSVCLEGIALWKVLPEVRKSKSKSKRRSRSSRSSSKRLSSRKEVKEEGDVADEKKEDEEAMDITITDTGVSNGMAGGPSDGSHSMEVVGCEDIDVTNDGDAKNELNSKSSSKSLGSVPSIAVQSDEISLVIEEEDGERKKEDEEGGRYQRLVFVPFQRILLIDVYSQPGLFFIRTSPGNSMTKLISQDQAPSDSIEHLKSNISENPLSSSSLTDHSSLAHPTKHNQALATRTLPKPDANHLAKGTGANSFNFDLSSPSNAKDSSLDLSYDITLEDESIHGVNLTSDPISNQMDVDHIPPPPIAPSTPFALPISKPHPTETQSTGLFVLACDRDDLIPILQQFMDLANFISSSKLTKASQTGDGAPKEGEKAVTSDMEVKEEVKLMNKKEGTFVASNGFEIYGRDWNLKDIPLELSDRWSKPEIIADADKESTKKLTPMKKPKSPVVSSPMSSSSHFSLPKVHCKRILEEQMSLEVEGSLQSEDPLISSSSGYCKPYAIGSLEATKNLLLNYFEEVRKELFGRQWPICLIFPCLRGLVHSSIQNSPPLYLTPPRELFHHFSIHSTVTTRAVTRRRENVMDIASTSERSIYGGKDQVVVEFPMQFGRESEDEATKGAKRYDSVRIHQQDIDRLVPGVFLNDILVDFYLKYIQLRLMGEESRKRVRIFRTHFYTLLSEDGYSRIASWTQQQNMFDYDFIIIPINLHLHWKVAVICNPGKAPQSYTSERKRLGTRPKSVDPEYMPEEKQKREENVKISSLPQNRSSSSSTEASQPPNKKKRSRDLEESATAAEDNSSAQELEKEPNPKKRQLKTSLPSESDSHAESKEKIGLGKDNGGAMELSSGLEGEKGQEKKRKFDSEIVSPKGNVTDQIPSETKEAPPGSIDSKDQSCILILDSLGAGRDSSIVHHLRTFITEESKKWNRPISHFDASNMTAYHPKVPQQTNYTDCGLFLLHYMERFCLDLPSNLSRDYVLKNLMGEEWFPTEEVDGKRRKIASCIDMLFRETHQGPETHEPSFHKAK